MNILEWRIGPQLKKEIEAHYRSTFSAKVHGKRPIDIIRDLTFDGVAPHVTLADMDQLLQYVHKYFLKGGLKGVGLEVGAGCGAFSAALACAPEVERVYGVEICEPVVRDLMPTVGRFVLGDELHKLIGVVGEFDNLEMENSSVDFVFDFFLCIIQAISREHLLRFTVSLNPVVLYFASTKHAVILSHTKILKNFLTKNIPGNQK